MEDYNEQKKIKILFVRPSKSSFIQEDPELLDELEIDEANVLVRGHEIVIRGKSLARKLRGIVKTRLSVEELEELYHTGI